MKSKFEQRDWRKFMTSDEKNKNLWDKMEEDVSAFFSSCATFIEKQKERDKKIKDLEKDDLKKHHH